MFAGLFAKVAANAVLGRVAANAKADWAAIPPKVKLAIAIGILVLILFFVHQHVAHKAIAAAEKRGYAHAIADVKAEQARTDARARARKQRIEAAAATITKKAEVHHEQAVADIAGDAGAMRLRWSPRVEPGRYAGGGLPGLPGPAGGGDGAAHGTLPELVEVPRVPLIDHGELCDVDRAKLETLQGWIRDQAALAKQMQNGGK
jgi:hypothetical protein